MGFRIENVCTYMKSCSIKFKVCREGERETHNTAAAMHENELERERQRVTEESGEFARPIKYAILFRAYNPNHLCLNFM